MGNQKTHRRCRRTLRPHGHEVWVERRWRWRRLQLRRLSLCLRLNELRRERRLLCALHEWPRRRRRKLGCGRGRGHSHRCRPRGGGPRRDRRGHCETLGDCASRVVAQLLAAHRHSHLSFPLCAARGDLNRNVNSKY